MPERPLPPGSTIGILGGGQLGRMLSMAAASLGLKTHIYSDEADAPAFDVAHGRTVGSYADEEALARFAGTCAAVTCEFENVPAATLEAAARVVPVFPAREILCDRPGPAGREGFRDRSRHSGRALRQSRYGG